MLTFYLCSLQVQQHYGYPSMGALSTTPTLARVATTMVGTTTMEVVVAATARSVGGSEARMTAVGTVVTVVATYCYLVSSLVPSMLFDAMQ